MQPAGSPDGSDLWTVDGVTILSDPAMEANANLKTGSLVAVNAYEANGSLDATRISPATVLYLPVFNR